MGAKASFIQSVYKTLNWGVDGGKRRQDEGMFASGDDVLNVRELQQPHVLSSARETFYLNQYIKVYYVYTCLTRKLALIFVIPL